MALTRQQAIIPTNASPIHLGIYAALGGRELTCWPQTDVQVILHVYF